MPIDWKLGMEDAQRSDARVIVVGAGDLGREVQAWFPRLNIRGYLDSSLERFADPAMPPILGKPETYEPRSDEVFVCAIASPARRLEVTQDLKARGARFISLVHDTVSVAPGSSLAQGCVLLPYVIIDINCHVGEQVVMYFRAGLGHDVVVGDACLILSNAIVGSRCVLGEGVTVSTLSFCNTGIQIGDYATIGAASFAIRDVPAYTTAVGVPARHVTKPSATAKSPIL